MTLLEQLRNPEEVKRWFDQIGDQAANEIESLQRRIAKLEASLRIIANYAGPNGCCPYGCDTPHIAQQALVKDLHDA